MSENFSIFSKVHDYWLSCGQSKLSPIIRPWDVSFKMSLFAQYFGYSSHVTRLPLSDVIVITVNRCCIEISLSWQHVATTSSGPGCNLEKKCSCFRLHHNHHSCFFLLVAYQRNPTKSRTSDVRIIQHIFNDEFTMCWRFHVWYPQTQVSSIYLLP